MVLDIFNKDIVTSDLKDFFYRGGGRRGIYFSIYDDIILKYKEYIDFDYILYTYPDKTGVKDIGKYYPIDSSINISSGYFEKYTFDLPLKFKYFFGYDHIYIVGIWDGQIGFSIAFRIPVDKIYMSKIKKDFETC